MVAETSEPKHKPEAPQHVYLRERMRKYNDVLQLIMFIIFSILPLIFWAMSRAAG
jgi:hypothetical protein